VIYLLGSKAKDVVGRPSWNLQDRGEAWVATSLLKQPEQLEGPSPYSQGGEREEIR